MTRPVAYPRAIVGRQSIPRGSRYKLTEHASERHAAVTVSAMWFTLQGAKSLYVEANDVRDVNHKASRAHVQLLRIVTASELPARWEGRA